MKLFLQIFRAFLSTHSLQTFEYRQQITYECAKKRYITRGGRLAVSAPFSYAKIDTVYEGFLKICFASVHSQFKSVEIGPPFDRKHLYGERGFGVGQFSTPVSLPTVDELCTCTFKI